MLLRKSCLNQSSLYRLMHRNCCGTTYPLPDGVSAKWSQVNESRLWLTNEKLQPLPVLMTEWIL